jgi:hypothetical protein
VKLVLTDRPVRGFCLWGQLARKDANWQCCNLTLNEQMRTANDIRQRNTNDRYWPVKFPAKVHKIGLRRVNLENWAFSTQRIGGSITPITYWVEKKCIQEYKRLSTIESLISFDFAPTPLIGDLICNTQLATLVTNCQMVTYYPI